MAVSGGGSPTPDSVRRSMVGVEPAQIHILRYCRWIITGVTIVSRRCSRVSEFSSLRRSIQPQPLEGGESHHIQKRDTQMGGRPDGGGVKIKNDEA